MSDTQTLTNFLVNRCPSFHNKYHAPLLLQISPVLHTILAQKYQSPHANVPIIKRQHIIVASGGNVAIDWLGNIPSVPSMVVIGFPGAGNCQFLSGLTPTLLCALYRLMGHEIAFGMAIYQGLGGLHLSSHKLPGSGYCSTDDVHAVLEAARGKFAKPIPLVVVASSFGTAFFANYAVRNRDNIIALGITGAVFLGFGHSVFDTGHALDMLSLGPINTMRGKMSKFIIDTWRKHLTDDDGQIINTIKQRYSSIDLDNLFRARTLYEWDSATLPFYGFATLSDLYAAADPVGLIDKMPIPTLFLNAEDDPLCPAKRLNGIEYDQPHFSRLTTKHGGHLGWFEKIPCGQSHISTHSTWLLNLVSEFIKNIPEYGTSY